MKATRSASFSSVSTMDACEIPRDPSSFRLLTISGRATRVAPGIGDLHQLEKTRDVLIVYRLMVKLLQHVEYHMRLEAFDLVAHRLDFLLHTERTHVMTDGAQGADDVVFRFPFIDFPRGVSVGGVRRHKVGMHQNQHAQTFHSAIHFRRDGPNNACMVLAVNRTMKSVRSFRSEPTTRRSSSRQRKIISSSTASSVNWFSPVQRAISCRMWARWRRMKDEAGCPRRCLGSAENNRERSRSYVFGALKA